MIVFLYQPLYPNELTEKNITPWEIHQRANREKMMVSDRICQDNMIAYLRGKWYTKLKEESLAKDSNPYGSSSQSISRKTIEITKSVGFAFTIKKWTSFQDITGDKE